MRSKWLPALVAAVALALPGCFPVPSENGLCADDGREGSAFDPDLLGRWAMVPRPGEEARNDAVTRFDRLDPARNTYVISSEWNGVSSPTDRCLVNLVKVGDFRYLDSRSEKPANATDKCHWFAKVSVDPGAMSIKMMSPDYFAKHPEALAHRMEPTGNLGKNATYIITARPAEIRAFLEKHGDDKELWDEESTSTYRRP